MDIIASVRNTGPVPCTLEGYPGIRFEVTKGPVTTITVQHHSSMDEADPGPKRIVIATGDSASVAISWSTAALSTGCIDEADAIAITLPGTRTELKTRTREAKYDICIPNVTAFYKGTDPPGPPIAH